MNGMYYVGLDVHKRTIAVCVKTAAGQVVDQRTLKARRSDLREWAASMPGPWIGGLEATLFTGWVYDTLAPLAQSLKVGHPAMMRAIGASKKKNDRLDALKVADLVRCDLLPECYMASREWRDLRRALRYRNFLVQQATRLKNKTAGLLMECGIEYEKTKLHGRRYFTQLLKDLGKIEDTPYELRQMLAFDHGMARLFAKAQRRVVDRLTKDERLRARVERLQTIRGVGQILALTWALEVGEPQRLGSIRKAISYCGLCSAQRESAGKNARGPISKQRNKHLQWALIEAAKIAPHWNERLKAVYERELARSNRNQATLAVARKLVAWLLAVDKGGKPFQERATADAPAASVGADSKTGA